MNIAKSNKKGGGISPFSSRQKFNVAKILALTRCSYILNQNILQLRGVILLATD